MNSRFYTAALAVLAGFTVAGCAGTSGTPGPAVANPASPAVASGHPNAAALRVDPAKAASYKRAIYVINSAANTVQILTNKYYRQLGAITYGISNPKGATVDKRGNLYVTNQAYPYSTIAQYAPGATFPSYTYNASYPEGVAVDRHGNIFVADAYYSSGGGGVVNQYAQGVRNPVASCRAGSAAYGVAVDANGNVFVSEWAGDYAASIYEFTGGFHNCNSTRLISLGNAYLPPTSLALDAKGNLVFPLGPDVNVIAPPYSAVTSTIGSGFSSVSGVSINKSNKLVYVSDSGAKTVTVINYQTDATVKQLGVPNGITQANGVVDAPNAVY